MLKNQEDKLKRPAGRKSKEANSSKSNKDSKSFSESEHQILEQKEPKERKFSAADTECMHDR